MQPIYTVIKPNKMAEESNNEFHNVVPLQIRFNDVDKFGHEWRKAISDYDGVINIEAK